MSFDYTGSFSGSFVGEVTASNGVISSSAQVNYTQVKNKPTTISAFQKNSIIANNNFRENTYPTDSASFATRISATDARIDGLSAGSGSADWSTITSIPSGLVSSSNQITDVVTDTYISASAASGGFGNGGGTSDFTQLTNVPSGLVSGSSQITDVVTDNYISASAAASGFGQGGGETYTEGNGIDIVSNVISLDTSSLHFRLGVSASAASYGFGSGGDGSFGDPPTIDQDGLQVSEFVASGSIVGTLTVTDPTPGDTATWAIQSSYTADLFKISSGGVVTANTLMTSSMNTTAGSGSNLSHPFLVQVTDGQNNVVTETIYIYVIPNSAPVFRQTSVGGTVITTFTASANENSTLGSTLGTIYFTDVNSDTITIETGSVPSEFDITVNATNVVITQATSSLDYETTTSYNMVITASDEHYQSGVDGDSIAYLPILINVVDNAAPTINNQTLSSINENSSNNAVVDSISANDAEGDTITFSNFTLRSAYLNGDGTNLTASLGGASLYDPHANPFNLNSSNGQVTRKSGVFLNADVADRYEYSVDVTDVYNNTTATGIITIPITDDAASNVSRNFVSNTYVIESAEVGDYIYVNTNGLNGTLANLTSGVSQRWEVASDGDLIEAATPTGSSTLLRLKNNVSGSIYSFDGTNTIAFSVTASEHGFETTKQYLDFTANLAINNSPSISFTNTSANLNTNGARSGSLLTTITFNDSENDALNHTAFTFTDPSGQLNAVKSGDTYLVQPLNNLSASAYQFTASIEDEHGFRTTTESHEVTIQQADSGSLTPISLYVIESATNGDAITTTTTGVGSSATLSVTYSPNYNSQVAQNFTSDNPFVSVSNSGVLTVGTDISGSGQVDGQTLLANIGWEDQYGNTNGDQITINITANNAPSVTTDTPNTSNWNENLAVDGALLATLVWSDVEGDVLDVSTFSLTGAGAANLSSSYNGSNTFGIYANGNQSAGVISYTANVDDVHGFNTGTYSDSITIEAAQIGSITSENFYIIESAVSGAVITNDTDGIGSQANVNVTYSPNYGSQVAQSFTTSDSVIAIDSNGNLSVKSDISGSYNGGSSLTPTINWQDQYGNLGSGSITINITNNNPATATFVNESVTAPVSQGTKLVTITISDTEGNTPYTASLSGDGAVSMSLSPQNADSSSWFIEAIDNSMTDGVTLNYTASITDAYGETTTEYNRQFVVNAAPVQNPLVYVYDIGASQDGGSDANNFLYTLGYQSATLATPSILSTATPYDGVGFADAIQSSLGGTSISYNWASGETATLLASASLNSMTDISSSLGYISKASGHRIAIIIPSGSGINDVPTSMDNGYGTAVSGRYVLEYAVDNNAIGSGLGTTETAYIHEITLDSAVNGVTDYIIISNKNPISSTTNILLDIRANDNQP